MGKRSPGFERRSRDLYETPRGAVAPLLPHLPGRCFIEPCCGRGALIRWLEQAGRLCVWASDVAPIGAGQRLDALHLATRRLPEAPIVTNPPWRRDLLHPMIRVFSSLRPTWLLFDADWAHTVQAAPMMGLCRMIVSVGRVKWIERSRHTGVDNAAWYHFDAATTGAPVFVGR